MNFDHVIITDASADVQLDVAVEQDVHFISMPIESDNYFYDCMGDDSDEKIKQFYADIRTGSLPKTTQITPYRYEEIIAPILEQGKSALYLCLSSGLSSTFEAAKMAAESLNAKYDAKFYPIDSIAATGSMGILTERMIKNRNSGMTVTKSAADIEEFKHRMYTTCYVEDLHHLKRGGRIGAAKAAIGSLLNIKPIIKITDDGKLENNVSCKGKKKAVAYLAETYEKFGDMTTDSPVYVSDCDNKEMADVLEEEVHRINPQALVRRRMLSPIIGTHLGPESVLIAFVKK